jgi:hypothetical protein
LTSLAKIGGLFALFKIGLLLSFVHEKMFEREVNSGAAKVNSVKVNEETL